MKFLITLGLCLFEIIGFPGSAKTQDVSQNIQKVKSRFEHPLSASGSIGLQLTRYQSNLPFDRAALFNGRLNALLNLGVLGIQTPMSFIYSSGGSAFNITLPSFVFAGISPTYRDYTLHIGDRSLTLGKYSFSNHSFRGVGGEINKDKWYSRFFYGRLQRAQISDFNGFEDVNPLFKRVGWGALAGFKPSAESRFEVSLFKAWDDPNSLTARLDSTLNLFAAENVILSTLIEQVMNKIIHIRFNYSASGYTDRINLEEIAGVNVFRSFAGVLETNKSTRWKNAFEFGLSVKSSIGQLQLNYERIDPGYRTLGALFFQDDQENITAGITTQLCKKKFALIVNGGIQNNNLDASNADEYRRLIGAIQANILATKKISFSASYSNFSSVNRQIRVLDPNTPNLLTELALTNLNINLGVQYRITDHDHVGANFSMQENQTITTTDHISEQLNHINNLTILYNHQWPSSQLILSIQGYYNQFKMSLIEQAQQGIGINLSQPFLEMKIKANLRVNYAQNQQEEFQSKLRKKGHLVQLRTGISWQISPAQVIRLEGLVLSNKGSNIDHFQERKVGMSYQAKLQKKKQ